MGAGKLHSRVIAIAIASMMLCFGLWGCGGQSAQSQSASSSSQASSQAQSSSQSSTASAAATEAKPKVVDSWFSSSQVFGQEDVTVYYVGLVSNPDKAHYWNSVRVKATALDASGSELGTSTSLIDVLEPGQTLPVYNNILNCAEEPASVEVELVEDTGKVADEAPEFYVPTADLSVSDLQIDAKEWANGMTPSKEITGTLVNASGRDVSTATLTFVYTKGGKVVQADMTYVWDVPAGSSQDFETMGGDVVDYDDVDVYIMGESL